MYSFHESKKLFEKGLTASAGGGIIRASQGKRATPTAIGKGIAGKSYYNGDAVYSDNIQKSDTNGKQPNEKKQEENTMTIKTEQSLRNFEFWSGAKSNAAMMTAEELDSVENELEAMYPEGMTDTEINDLFWFDFEYVCELIGLEYDADKDEIIRD